MSDVLNETPAVLPELSPEPTVLNALVPIAAIAVAAEVVPAPVEQTPEPAPEVVKPKRVKAKAKLAKKVPAKNGRGRPKVYTGKLERYIASLIRRYGQVDARHILNAGNSKKDESLRGLRDLEAVPKPLGISLPTLVSISKAAKIELKRGRRPAGTTVLEKTLAKLNKAA